MEKYYIVYIVAVYTFSLLCMLNLKAKITREIKGGDKMLKLRINIRVVLTVKIVFEK